MWRVGDWWEGEGRGTEGRRVVRRGGEGCGGYESGGKGMGEVRKI